MKLVTGSLAAFGLLLAAGAEAAIPDSRDSGAGPRSGGYVSSQMVENEALPYLQCVPYARQVSGIQIFGDAWTWWDQAEGLYNRGNKPRVGAVMSFRPHGNMQLGHVAAVSRVIDSRTVLLRHANWSIIDGRRGQVEDNVRAIDVSPGNDWSAVRVWFAPIGDLGTTHWPLNGFIYPEAVRQPGKARTVVVARTTPATAPRTGESTATPSARPVRLAALDTPQSSRIGSDFLKGIRPEVSRQAPVVRRLSATGSPAQSAAKRDTARPVSATAPARTASGTTAKPAARTAATQPVQRMAQPAQRPAQTAQRPAQFRQGTGVRSDDPIGRIIASRSR